MCLEEALERDTASAHSCCVVRYGYASHCTRAESPPPYLQYSRPGLPDHQKAATHLPKVVVPKLAGRAVAGTNHTRHTIPASRRDRWTDGCELRRWLDRR